MAQLQWLGKIERPQSKKDVIMGNVAKAIEGGVKGYKEAQALKTEKQKTAFSQNIQTSGVDIDRKELEYKYSKLDYDKKKDMYDTIAKLLPNVPAEKQIQLTNSAEWQELENSLGLPHLSGTTVGSGTKPSWAQEQEDRSMRADIIRGRGSISIMGAEPIDFPIDTLDQALDYISKKGRDPAEFKTELAKYGKDVTAKGGKEKSPYKEYPDAYSKGGKWYVNRGGKRYRIEE